MASTINASTSAGIIQSADTSGVLALQTGGTTAVTVNTTGSVAFGTSASSYGTSGQVLTSNGNAAPTWQAPSGFVSGTVMLFVQTAAPTGWTKSSAHNNKALRVVTGSVSTGGTVAFTTAFASQAVSGTVGSTTLAITEMPSHQHTANFGTATGGNNYFGEARNNNLGAVGSAGRGSTGGGGSHNHTFTGTAIDLAVQYVDVIIATKD